MENLEKDIKEAIKLAHGESRSEMTEYSKCFFDTSENIKGYMQYISDDYKTALLPTSSGDHQLEAILHGITDMTNYDINKLAKYFAKLKFAAIKSLKKDEYIKYMYEDILNKEILSYIKENLDDNIYQFWNELFSKCDKDDIYFRLFKLMGIYYKNDVINHTEFSKYCALNFCSYLEEDNYKKVQEKLDSVKMNYIDSDILEIKDKLDGNYDFINLTNIHQNVNTNPFRKDVLSFSKTCLDLIEHLNEDGTILLNYLYKYNLKDLKKYSNKSIHYAHFLHLLLFTPYGRSNFNLHANKHNRKTLWDKIDAFRSFEFIRYLDGLNIDGLEVENVGLGRRFKSETDLALTYTKTKK